MNTQDKTYKITEISNALNIGLHRIREWKNRGLIPFEDPGYGSTKRYTLEQVQQIYITYILKGYGVHIKPAFKIAADYFNKPIILVRRDDTKGFYVNSVFEPDELPDMMYDYVTIHLEKLKEECKTAIENYTP